jgi:NagD protein
VTEPRYAAVVFDLDGTIYLDGRALPGAVATVTALRECGVGILFLSNNPLADSAAYARRLTGMGFPVGPEEVVTSGGVLASWLAINAAGAGVYLIGEESLKAELSAAGVRLEDDAGRADIVVASFDRTFDYDKWLSAHRAIGRGARFIATNPDLTCPTADGGIPDCGGIIAAIEASVGRRVELVVGKPSPLMMKAALDRLGIGPREALMVGDRLQTDIAMAVAGGVDSALVLTGVTDAAAAARSRLVPTYVLQGIHELTDVVLESAAAG